MLKFLYHWMLKVSAAPRAAWGLAAVSFAESSFFPVPPDVMLVPMALARPKRAFFYAGLTTLFSVLGGLAGYLIGFYLFDSLAQPVLDFYGYHEQFAAFTQKYNDAGFWLVFTAGLTPIPFKIFTIASGVTHMNLVIFLLGAILSRGIRFFLEAALLWKFGEAARLFIEKYLGLIASAALALLFLGFMMVKYIF